MSPKWRPTGRTPWVYLRSRWRARATGSCDHGGVGGYDPRAGHGIVSMSAAGYDIGAWADFAVGVTGAAAALTGLLFVAVSINLQRILTSPGLPSRALQTLVLFFTPLLVCVLLLVPGQSGRVLGVELLVLGGLVGVLLARLTQRPSRVDRASMASLIIGRIVPSTVAVLGTIAAGISLAIDAGGGLMWIVPAVLAALMGGLTNVWVLLIEIQR